MLIELCQKKTKQKKQNKKKQHIKWDDRSLTFPDKPLTVIPLIFEGFVDKRPVITLSDLFVTVQCMVKGASRYISDGIFVTTSSILSVVVTLIV